MAEHDSRDQRVLEALAGLADGGPELEQPPAGLWDRIAEEAFADDGEAEGDGEEPAPLTTGAIAVAPPPVVSLDAHRARRRPSNPWVLRVAAVVAAVFVGLGAAWFTFGRDGGGGGSSPQAVATADLEPLAEVGRGTATVVEADGQPTLELEVEDLPATAGFYEVWVATPDLEGLVSLGPVRADGTYDLPEGFDPGELPVVDVSDEPLDGDPTHSTVSVLRGTLQA